MELITDRTEMDVLMGNKKGCYTVEDLNRVEHAVETLAELAGLNVDTKTDWDEPSLYDCGEWPVDRQMHRYLQNVRGLCESFLVTHSDMPDSMERLDWKAANAIEEALMETGRRILGMIQIYQYSGELIAGEEILL